MKANEDWTDSQKIPGLCRIGLRAFPDARGTFWECYREAAILEGLRARADAIRAEHGIDDVFPGAFVQDNVSRSAPGVLRGMHAQDRDVAQGKLVHVLQGRIIDVVIEARPELGPDRVGRFEAFELSAEIPSLLYVPPGCLHGFYVQPESADAIVMYRNTTYYHARNFGVHFLDEAIQARETLPWWDIPAPTLSEKDGDPAQCLTFAEALGRNEPAR